jgi:queuine tRNA-ribosyltransferase
VALTTAWAARCRAAQNSPSQKLLAIVQGAVFKDLREQSAARLVEMDFFGYAIGGLSVGEEPAQTAEYAAFTASLLPENKIRYLMGVGRPEDIAPAVAAGVDMFDCVVPTREGRHGTALAAEGRIKLRQSPHRNDERPVDEECGCYTCRRFSRAYLRHLFLAGEHLAGRLVSIHNLYHLHGLAARLREKIISENN